MQKTTITKKGATLTAGDVVLDYSGVRHEIARVEPSTDGETLAVVLTDGNVFTFGVDADVEVEVEVTFYAERDDYGRSCHAVVAGPGRYVGERIGSIVRLPKRTYPVPTFLVNDFRVTRGLPNPAEGIVEVGSLKEAKALFA